MSPSGVMSQQLVPQSPGSVALQQIQKENADLKKYLAAQRVVIASLERRAGRSLDAMGVHLKQLTGADLDPPAWQSHLSSVQNEVNCLCDLLADTMLLQKLEAGKVEIKLEPLDLQPILHAASRHLLEPKDGSPVRLMYEQVGELPQALADQDLTEAVISDLLSRGLKYSDQDSPVVLGVARSRHHLCIRITAQRFAPIGNRDFATEIVLCCRRVEVQMGEVTCQQHPDGLQTVTIALQIAPGAEN